MSIGVGPAVYLLINIGNRICSGTIGKASIANFSFGTPNSTSFNPVTASAAAKPIYKVIKIYKVKKMGI